MAKILFLADLHGNMPATLALEKEIQRIKPDDIYFVGDALGKGPESHKTIDWVRKNCNHFVAGNWDLICAEWSHNCPEGHEQDAFYWNQIGKERIEWIESLPLEDEIWISGINFRIFHGRPVDKNYHSNLNFEQLESAFTDTKGKVYGGFICADCHMPYVRELASGYALNTGSVGNSLGVPRCHALVIEGDLNSRSLSPISFSILSIPYDNQLAAKIADDYPDLPNKDAYKKEVLTGVYGRE